MVRQTISCALMGFAMLQGAAQGINIYVTNKCDKSMTLAHVTPKGVTTDELALGGTITKSIEPNSDSHVLKSGTGAEATLAEFSTMGGKCWYDISAIPTGKKSGPGYCTSLQDCKTVTGGVGFNVPLQITPHSPDGDRCVQLTCLIEDCRDAYQFPKDDTKTHTCPLSVDFNLTFCAGGSGGSLLDKKSAPTPVYAPTQTSAPVPNPPSGKNTSPILEKASPSPEITSPSLKVTSPSPESLPPSPESLPPSPKSTYPSTEKMSSSTIKKPSSSPEQIPSLTTGSFDPTYEQQSIDQSEESPVSVFKSKASNGTLRKENGNRVTSLTTQQTTETNQQIQKTDDAKNSATTSNKDEYVQQISNRSAEKSGGATFIFVGVVALCVVMVAAATIMAVRKKKAQLEELESKTPQSTTAHSTLASFRTPRNNVSVL